MYMHITYKHKHTHTHTNQIQQNTWTATLKAFNMHQTNNKYVNH